jgi:hypothetical protein
MAIQNPKPDDIQVDGPYSPISLEKLKKVVHLDKEFSVLLDQSGLGFAHDDPNILYMTIQERKEQAVWWMKNNFDGRRIPAWLYRYLHYMFNDGDFKYKDHLDVVACMQEGKIKEDDEEYQRILALIKHCETNVEAAQIIGFVMLMVGTLNQCRKDGIPPKIFIEQPETSLHPKRTAKWMSLFYDFKDKWGPK